MSRYIDIEPYEKDGWYLQKRYRNSYGEVIKTTPLVSVPTAEVEPYIEFCEWVADTVLYEDFEDKWTLGAFVEVACRKLYKLGFIRKDGRRSRDGEIIRCKDCAYAVDHDEEYVYCSVHDSGFKLDGFCSEGEPVGEVYNG